MPRPGLEADRIAAGLYGRGDLTDDQLWAALEYAPLLRSEGRLAAEVRIPTVVYPERPRAGYCLCRKTLSRDSSRRQNGR